MTRATPQEQPSDEPNKVPGMPETGESKPNGGGEPKAEKAKAKKNEAPREPLPDVAKKAPETPKGKRIKADYDVNDIIADASDDDEYSEAAPVIPKLIDKLPKAKYIQIRSGKGAQTQIYAIKLDEEDQRPGELNSYVLTKPMRDFFVNELQYKVTKMNVCDVCTLQGQQSLYMYSAASDLSGNSWNVSRVRMIEAATHGWIIVSTDMEAREYVWRHRRANLPEVKPRFPTEPIAERVIKAVQGSRLIASQDHPVVKRLLGIVEGDEEDNG
jgi:hypothetical protein